MTRSPMHSSGSPELLDVDRANLIGFAPQTGRVVSHPLVDRRRPRSGGAAIGLAGFSLGVAAPSGRRSDRRARGSTICPPRPRPTMATWRRVGVKANLTVPMTVGGRIEGAIAIASVRRERHWPGELVSRLRILADVFGNALAYKRARESLDSAMKFERLVSEMLAALLTTDRAEDRDRVIEAGLRDMALILGAERATLWERIGASPSSGRRTGGSPRASRSHWIRPAASRSAVDQRAARCRRGRPLREPTPTCRRRQRRTCRRSASSACARS